MREIVKVYSEKNFFYDSAFAGHNDNLLFGYASGARFAR